MANAIRALSMDAVEKAKSGHPGMPMGMADVATVLFTKFLKFSPENPTWADRDRFILSAGHGSMLLYSLLWLTGYNKISLDEIKNFRQLHSLTPGHPEVMQDAGIETTTGPLGQGISNAVGFALAERILNARFGSDLVDHHTYVIASDGDLMEGISHESCALAGHLKLNRLIALYDDNGICIDGPTSLSYSDDVKLRFEAYGWDVQTVDGHDFAAIENAIARAHLADKPSIICCKTTIGFGAPTKAGTAGCHGSPLGDEEIKGAREQLSWPHEPFFIPTEILMMWRQVGQNSAREMADWVARLEQNRYKADFLKVLAGDVSTDIQEPLRQLKDKYLKDRPKLATRQTSGDVLEKIIPALPHLIGGSSDLTPSNNTQVKGPSVIGAGKYEGQYIHYGVREHGMAATMNGMALHGGVIPYGGTFMQFTDYCRPSIRLSALMKQRVVYVMTHDSIGLGEDGPTHQPVEHLAALRAIPNLLTLRPADGVETAECWEIALTQKTRPSVLALTRQGLPTVRTDDAHENLSAKGAYILKEAGNGQPKVVVMASGSEVEIALGARDMLEDAKIPTRVVSVPSIELFAEQDSAYQERIMGDRQLLRVAVEAAVRQSWDRWLGFDGIFIGMSTFGESAPIKDLYSHFKITKEAVAEAVKARI
ncbi:MAG: transketolase [Micavibrio aeruginosavorus]|uniref:Transketolase n=1 Tax=Micavibrio aeruginosavorus TaxID=349221 RepID=A0A7T5R4I4_9BACT|nr:MAG: transketolase [Micavibrio aeruginosavorus]